MDFQYLQGWKKGRDFFTRECTTGQGITVLNLKSAGLRLNKKKFFTQRAVRCWHRLPREAVGASSLEVFKARLDGTLGSLSRWVATSPCGRGAEAR